MGNLGGVRYILQGCKMQLTPLLPSIIVDIAVKKRIFTPLKKSHPYLISIIQIQFD